MCIQARESAALRETLMAEREASSAELAALRTTIQKLESQLQEKPPPGPVISEKEAEERRRAEEKAAQEILQLKEVGLQTINTLSSFYLVGNASDLVCLLTLIL